MPRINWQQYDHLFTSHKESVIANLIGCSWATVHRRRVKLGVPRVSIRRARWTAEDEALYNQGVLRCRACSEVKSISCFSKSKKATKGLRVICSVCHNTQTMQRRRAIKTKWLNEMGGCACRICGFDKSLASLQFHHVDGKDQDPAQMMYSKNSDDVIRSELSKCCVLCANCHVSLHAKEIAPEFVKSETHLGYKVRKNDLFK
jgi:hypothetical protein